MSTSAPEITSTDADALTPRQQRRAHWSEKYASWMSGPMIFVSLAFLLGFLALRLPDQSSAFRSRVLTAMAVCWLVFVLDFVIRVLLAPHRGKYVALHPLVLVSIIVPPLRAICSTVAATISARANLRLAARRKRRTAYGCEVLRRRCQVPGASA